MFMGGGGGGWGDVSVGCDKPGKLIIYGPH